MHGLFSPAHSLNDRFSTFTQSLLLRHLTNSIAKVLQDLAIPPSLLLSQTHKRTVTSTERAVRPIKASSNEDNKVGEEEHGGGHATQHHQGDSSSSPGFMDNEQERKEWRRVIRQVIDQNPHVEEETDPAEKRNKMHKLLAQYPLVVEEEDPDWPDDADGWGFNLGQFFDKITIKNVKRNHDDDNYDSDKELVWQDDDYIRPIKHITTKEWEDTVFKDISPLVVFVHNRYRRSKENEEARDGLEKAAHIFWNSRLPSPRCVAIDAVVELDLVAALKVSTFPEIIFTKAGKILHREKSVRNADELSKMMAFFYYGAAKPPCLDINGDCLELIPSVPNNSEHHK
ncbi:hypothetical protein Sjap_009599 [Stephania japonica]|uniref:Thioredoxin-like fold domain-containing protein MRL7L, chloroplastic n=1 Tax=Stephania japonica TaxID=461633 RepID=A0AAP0JU10_9MAGN